MICIIYCSFPASLARTRSWVSITLNFTTFPSLFFVCCLNTENPTKLSIPDQWQSNQEKKDWFNEVISSYLSHFVVGSSDMSTIVEQVERLNQNADGRYPCRAPDCDKTYAFHSGRVRLVGSFAVLLLNVYFLENIMKIVT